MRAFNSRIAPGLPGFRCQIVHFQGVLPEVEQLRRPLALDVVEDHFQRSVRTARWK